MPALEELAQSRDQAAREVEYCSEQVESQRADILESLIHASDSTERLMPTIPWS